MSSAASGTGPGEVRSDLASLMRVWALAGPLRGRVLRGIAFRFAQSLSLGVAFTAVVWIVTGLADGRAVTWAWIGQVTAVMALSLIGQLAFGYLSARDSWLSSYELAGGLRRSILDRLRRLPMGFHLARHKGDTVTVLTSDMQMLETFLSDALPRIAQAFGLPLVVLVFLVIRDPVIALATVASILLALPIFLWSSRRLAVLGIRRQDRQAEAGARMIEYAQGIAVIRAFNRVAKGEESFRAALMDFRDISVRMVVQLTAPLVGFGLVLMLGVPLVMLVAGVRYLGGEIGQGTFITAMVLVFSAYSPLLALLAVMELTRMADASLTRIDRIMTAERLPEPATPVAPRGFAVRFEDVGFAYVPGKPVLSGVSFEAPERSMTAIVGPSGSGKTTLLNLIPRFWDIDAGRIGIGGADVREIGEEGLNRLVTVVFQDVYLFAGTILDNIAFGRPGATEADVEAAARAARAHDFIAALPDGYRTRVGEGGATLSGGERQRISIARAILKDAPIVLLDEATAAIDPTNELAIQEALARLVADKTLIVVAHKLSTIRAADQILVVDQGRIVERGAHEALLAQGGLYSGLWGQRARAAGWRLGA
ncbi:ABC transporter ATP-binding protein [Phenylobacterium sp.]|uniref:ABC transporter ATP-binding protein n=1 Tax=Phenylobacterium sp. TaxID=1871053 RepID=UPI0025FD0CA5|nr:ABC transporter ATP-binding protein [Phenylobacterium sp.]MBX3482471.1 ABC transporter ATP-binding protein [Phenylobacterium sp.]MCW5760822.1 ABC transporter ATP-binding protein [Phenylobacterium sp.]